MKRSTNFHGQWIIPYSQDIVVMKIMNPLKSKPWKSRFYFHGIIHSPRITHETLNLASVSFHGIFKRIWWVSHNVRDFMGHEWGNVHRIFMPFLMLFSCHQSHEKSHENLFSNSLIIHAALTQPEHRILVRWMGLETQWKRVKNTAVSVFQTRMQIFILIKQKKKKQYMTRNNFI